MNEASSYTSVDKFSRRLLVWDAYRKTFLTINVLSDMIDEDSCQPEIDSETLEETPLLVVTMRTYRLRQMKHYEYRQQRILTLSPSRCQCRSIAACVLYVFRKLYVSETAH